MLLCKECNDEIKNNRKIFCSEKCRSKNRYKHNKNELSKSIYKSQKKRRHSIKNKIVLENGGCCSNCGYNKNLSSLSFHHTSIKNFNLTGDSMMRTNISLIQEELKTCNLLCMNCHIALHNPDYTLDFYKNEYDNIEELIKKFI